jgi:hypothetical protein
MPLGLGSSQRHYPAYIHKGIDKAMENFKRDGKDPHRQSFSYVWKALIHQTSLKNPPREIQLRGTRKPLRKSQKWNV